MADTVDFKVTNAREVRQAFRRLEKDVQKTVQRELRQVAEPVAASVRARLQQDGGFTDATVTGVKAGTSVGIARVRQSMRKTTGDHPEYGSAQMERAFLPVLREYGPRIMRDVVDAIDRATGRFNNG